MTDQPVPDRDNGADRSDNLTTHPNLDREDAHLATGTGDPATSDAGPTAQQDDAGDGAPAGDTPKPSPDI